VPRTLAPDNSILVNTTQAVSVPHRICVFHTHIRWCGSVSST